MKYPFPLLAGAVLIGSLCLTAHARAEPSHERLGASKPITEFIHIEVKNFQDDTLGRIKDLGLDLVNGRIVEVLVESDSSLDVGGKIVAVPPLAIIPDPLNKVYRINISPEDFKAAPGIDLAKWQDAGRSENVAAAYRHFGQQPYFLEEGDTAAQRERPLVALGYVERCNKLLDMPVGNLQGHSFGKVWSMTLDIPRGRILNVIVLAPGNFKTKSIIPAMALSFDAERKALLLDDSKLEFADEPRYVLTEAAYGNEATAKEESYKGPRTNAALAQGDSYFDVDRTVRINRDLRTSKLNARSVQVGTINGRVTLRGWVRTEEDRRRVGEIAIAASRLELVDNQVTVGKPGGAK